jgi:hypothetical protein
LTKDSTTGMDGDSQSLNRYIYVLNNPVMLIDINGLFSFAPLGVAALEFGQSLGQAELAGASAFFTGAEAGGLVLAGHPVRAGLTIASGVWSSVSELNDSLRSAGAAGVNIGRAIRDQQYVLPADVSAPMDELIQSKVGTVITAANTVYSVGSGLYDLTKSVSDLRDAATLLYKYGNRFSPETLLLAKSQLLRAAYSLYDLGANTIELNSIVSELSGSPQVANKPFIPEGIDTIAILNRPQTK